MPSWLVIWLIFSCKFLIIQCLDENYLTMVEGVQNYYLTPSSFIVVDEHQLDFEREKSLLELIKGQSQRNHMTQVITYEILQHRLSKRRENALYTLFIHDSEDLEHAINVTKGTDMSIHPWFLYIKKSANFDCNKPFSHFFKLRMDTWMSAMCEGNPVLKSYQGLYDYQTEVVDLAVWNTDKLKLEFENESALIKAHMDLRGITLRLASKLKRSDLTDDVNANVANFNFDLIDEVKNLSNFKTRVTVVDTELGYLDHQTNKWYGMSKTIADKEADIGVALFTMSHTRLKVVDYAIPLAKGRCNLYIKLPEDAEVSWSTYFKVFDKRAWAVIGASVLIFTALVCVVKNGIHRLSSQAFFEDFINIWGAYTMQGSSENSARNSVRMIYFSILMFALLLNATYSGSITSYITVLSRKLPFSNFKEFLQDRSYSFIVVRGSRDHSLVFANNSRLSPLRKRLKKDRQLPANAYQGFQQACDEKTAFYTDEVKYDSMQNDLPCQLGTVFMDQVEYMSFILTKNSPYKSSINYNILRLSDYGIVNRLRDKYFQKFVELPDLQPSVIRLKEVSSILIIWAIGLAITILCLFIEIVVFRCTNSNNTTKITMIHDNVDGVNAALFHKISPRMRKDLP